MAFRPHENLWQITDGQRLRYLGAVLAMGVTNLCIFAAPFIGGYAIDVVVEDDFAYGHPWLVDASTALFGEITHVGYLWFSALVALLITAFGGCFLFLRGRFAALASENITRQLREMLFSRLHHVQASFYDTADTGDLVQRCSSDVETIRVFLASDIIEIGRAIMLLLCVMPFLLTKDERLAWLSLCLMPFLAIGAYIFFSKVKEVFQITDESEAAMTATLQENLTGIRVVRAFARQGFEIEKFGEKNAAFRDNNYRLIQLMGYYWATSDLFAMSQIGIVLFVGAVFIQQGSLTAGDLFAIMTSVSMVIWPVRHMGRVLTDSGKAVVSLGRINEVLTEAEESQEVVPPAGRARGEINFERLSFAYGSGLPVVLDDISLHIAAGETIAFVGPPGSGKSTLIRVLLRLYPYQSGTVQLDAQDITTINRQWLRAQVGVVLQDPFLYSRSVAANLAVGRPGAPHQDIIAACQDAAIHQSIQSFPDTFNAMVGERGVSLSGGQRQRLALARALLKDAPILVLDDSLSAVDTGTERDILQALSARRGRQTTIIIAHRLSSVIDADRIVVLDHGRIVQLGNHATLAATDGPYQRLYAIQGALDASIQADVAVTERS
ncbi:MAG: ABC transporter ATP-binding protein [Pseudomonadales bacterium]|jgi:ATP-binding cassette subfamily B protein|nr:ABC transporter ATP-binding protein [Pseudomonadales bacterium]MDP6470589.1 ABC transporter ATP-binding protein [Pseudomonadales bacterium]MDP6828556.1 ABC transporter ATP-binding protein [Pseudomonadales bacterium]MDP6972042.1 ABC transporter ATP-binding protein [Pseudomonadales bacterium]|tara:strand:+ start:72 stop:1898 length:1827 start_codon:yes stop_codon:yes gene_type:complete